MLFIHSVMVGLGGLPGSQYMIFMAPRKTHGKAELQ